MDPAEQEQQAQYSAAAAGSVEPARHSGIRRLLTRKTLLIGAISVLVLSGVAIAAKTFYFEAPNRVVAKSMKTLEQKVTSLEYDGEVSVTYSGFGGIQQTAAENPRTPSPEGGSNGSATVKVTGRFNQQDPKDPLSAALFDVSTSSSEEKLSVAVDTRTTASTFYFKLLKLPDLKGLGFDFSPFENQWVKIEAEDVQTAEAERSKAAESPRNSRSTRRPTPRPTPTPETKSSEQKQKESSEAFQKHNPFSISKSLPGEKIDGQDTFHYAYTIDKEKIRALLPELYRINTDSELDKDDRKEFDESLNAVNFEGGQLWIWKHDYRLARVTTGVSMSDVDSKDADASVRSRVDFRNYNEKITVDIPAGAKTFEDIMTELQAAAEKDTDKDGLSDAEENLYGTNPKNPDSDKDGHRDGSETDRGFNPNGSGRLEDGTTQS